MSTHDGRSDASRSSCCASKNFWWAYVDRLFEKLPDWQELWLISSWPSKVRDRVPSLCRRGKYAQCFRLIPHLALKYSIKYSDASIFPFFFLISMFNGLKIYLSMSRKVFCKRMNQFLHTAIMYDIIKLDFAFTFQIRDYLIIWRAYIMFLLFSRKLPYYSRKFKQKI